MKEIIFKLSKVAESALRALYNCMEATAISQGCGYANLGGNIVVDYEQEYSYLEFYEPMKERTVSITTSISTVGTTSGLLQLLIEKSNIPKISVRVQNVGNEWSYIVRIGDIGILKISIMTRQSKNAVKERLNTWTA